MPEGAIADVDVAVGEEAAEDEETSRVRRGARELEEQQHVTTTQSAGGQ